MKNRICGSLLIFVSLLILLPQFANAKKIALNPSNQTGNLVCGGGNEAQYAELSATQASNKLTVLGHTVKIFYGFTGVPTQVNTWGAEAFLSMHTNAVTSDGSSCLGTASGTETLYNKDHKESDTVIASRVQAGLVNCLGLRDRGYKVWINPQTGLPDNLYILSGVSAPNSLEEALFHDNPSDSAILRTSLGQEKIGSGVSNGVHTYFGGTPGPCTGTSLPDLVVTSLTGPTTGTIGGQISVSVNIANQGSANAGSFQLGFYFSTDSTITTSDTYSGYICNYPSGLAAGQTNTCSGPIGVPSSLTPGIYYLGAIVDNLGQVNESNENTAILGEAWKKYRASP